MNSFFPYILVGSIIAAFFAGERFRNNICERDKAAAKAAVIERDVSIGTAADKDAVERSGDLNEIAKREKDELDALRIRLAARSRDICKLTADDLR